MHKLTFSSRSKVSEILTMGLRGLAIVVFLLILPSWARGQQCQGTQRPAMASFTIAPGNIIGAAQASSGGQATGTVTIHVRF